MLPRNHPDRIRPRVNAGQSRLILVRGKIPGSSSSGSLTSPENGQLQHKGREFQRVGGLSITFKPQTRANVIRLECNEPVHIVDIEDAIALRVNAKAVRLRWI